MTTRVFYLTHTERVITRRTIKEEDLTDEMREALDAAAALGDDGPLEVYDLVGYNFEFRSETAERIDQYDAGDPAFTLTYDPEDI